MLLNFMVGFVPQPRALSSPQAPLEALACTDLSSGGEGRRQGGQICTSYTLDTVLIVLRNISNLLSNLVGYYNMSKQK